MYLTYKSEKTFTRPIKDHFQIEILLENFDKRIEEIANEIIQLKENIKSTQQLIEMSLANTRNRILRFNVKLGTIFNQKII